MSTDNEPDICEKSMGYFHVYTKGLEDDLIFHDCFSFRPYIGLALYRHNHNNTGFPDMSTTFCKLFHKFFPIILQLQVAAKEQVYKAFDIIIFV